MKRSTLTKSNSAILEEGLLGDTTQFWREIDHVHMETLMGGTQGEEPHKAYKEGDGSHLRLA